MNARSDPRPTHRRGHLPTADMVLCAVFCWAVLCWAPTSHAAEQTAGDIIPVTGDGWKLTIDTRWANGYGYRPARVTVTPMVPSLVKRTLTVELRLFSYGTGSLRVRQDIEVPPGKAPVQASLSVPCFQYADYGCQYQVSALEDGQPLPNLTATWAQNVYLDRSNVSLDAQPTLVVVGDRLPDTVWLTVLFSNIPVEQFVDRDDVIASAPFGNQGQLPTAAALSMTELSERWIDYSSLDVLCLSLDDLAKLKADRPKAFRAVLRWTTAGGNLWAYGVGSEWERLDRLERLLGLSKGASDQLPAERGWDLPISDGKRFQGAWGFMPGMTQNGQVYPFDAPVPGQESPSGSDTELSSDPAKPHFVHREYGLGMVLALAADDPFPGTAAQWNSVLNTVGTERLLWSQRHGVSMVSENPDYWKFLIPGVGAVPVMAFLVLITLFMLAVGPVNYWFLRRIKRLYLLVVTIPGSAIAVTLFLFAYAMISDGLGTRVRVRSVTHIDQSRKQAACWSRLSYYAGLTPRDGLTFSRQTAVLPLRETPEESNQQQRELVWQDEQRLRSGWLSSRTPTQYLTMRSRATERGLQLQGSPDGEKPPSVKNNLGTKILQLIVCLDDGKLYHAAKIDADSVAPLRSMELIDARVQLSKVMHENEPEFPTYSNWRSGNDLLDMRGRRGYYYRRQRYGNMGITPATQQTGRLEQTLGGLSSLGGSSYSPKPNTYVAIVQRSPEVELGTPSASEEASFHVILGKW